MTPWRPESRMNCNKKILLVDDEEIIRLSFKRELQAFYEVSTASSCDEALSILANAHFDMLISDLVMPGLNGLELLKKIKSSHPETCVIIITGYGETKTVIETLRGGADDFLLKPFDFDILLHHITTTFARQEQLTTVRLCEKILSTTTDLVALVDTNGKFLEANQAYLCAFGRNRQTTVGASLAEVLGSVQFDTKVAPWLSRCFAGSAVRHLELFRLGERGLRNMVVSYCPHYALETTTVTGAVISMTDVTEILRDGLSLQQDEERLRLVHQVSANCFLDWDIITDHTYYNSNWSKLLGHGPNVPEEYTGSWRQLLHPDDKEPTLQALRDCIDGREESFDGQMRLQHSAGHWLWLRIRGKVVERDHSGRALRFIGLISDIDQQRQIQEEFVRRNESLLDKTAEQAEELNTYNKELEQVNAALNIVLKQREQDKEALETRMSENVLQLVEPLIKRLQRTSLDDEQFHLINEIEDRLHEITSSFITRLTDQAAGLTPMEIQVAAHVKQGKATKEIAEILCLAPDTINVHRKKIRKKLGLSNKSINLQTFLTSLSEK